MLREGGMGTFHLILRSDGFGKPLDEGSHLKFIAWWFYTVTAVLFVETLIIHSKNIDKENYVTLEKLFN